MKNTAHIIETERGWVIYPPERPQPVSACPTYADAVRRCRLNGWEVDSEPQQAVSEPEHGIWIGALILGAVLAAGTLFGLMLGQ